MSSHENAAPVDKKFFSPGMILLTSIMIAGLGFGLYRLLFSLGAVTNLNDQYSVIFIDVAIVSGD